MSTAAPPRLSGGMLASVVLHGGLIAALFILRPGAPRPSAPMFKVQLIAAPAGERAAGVVQPTPAAVPDVAPPAPIPTTTKTTVAAKKIAPNAKVKPAPTPKIATPTPAPPAKAAADQQKKSGPVPTAGGGATGGNGADVANVSTNGIEFPYQPYINNIASKIIQNFHTSARCTTEVRFVIRRDGTVDPDGIHLGESSCPYAINLQAMGAVEAAGKGTAFGPLPTSFREDILPVTFRFSPSLIR